MLWRQVLVKVYNVSCLISSAQNIHTVQCTAGIISLLNFSACLQQHALWYHLLSYGQVMRCCLLNFKAPFGHIAIFPTIGLLLDPYLICEHCWASQTDIWTSFTICIPSGIVHPTLQPQLLRFLQTLARFKFPTIDSISCLQKADAVSSRSQNQ